MGTVAPSTGIPSTARNSVVLIGRRSAPVATWRMYRASPYTCVRSSATSRVPNISTLVAISARLFGDGNVTPATW